MNTTVKSLILCSSLILSVSCSKDSENAKPKIIEEACLLLSASEASAITGETYTDTQTSEQEVVGLKICGHNTDDNGLLQISLTQTAAINGAGLTTAKAYYESMKTAFTDREMVTGVGDEAFIANNNGFLYILYTDNYYINIYLTQSGLPMDPNRWTAAQKKSKKIAAGKKAVENLQKWLGQ
jgi:hypothetical protein